MRCEIAREQLSAAADGALEVGQERGLDAHVSSCVACAAHREHLASLRRAVRYEPVGQVPDVAPAVMAMAAAQNRRRRRRDLVGIAAAFAAAVVAGAAFVGLDVREPAQVRADVPERVLVAQTQVTSLTAEVSVAEHGWHAAVPERRYEGRLAYRAPESLALVLTDRTAYPDEAWVANDVEVVADGQQWWARGPAPCPIEALPGCADPTPRVQVVTGREPFRAATPVPLDLVVPVRSFALAGTSELLGTRTIAGREAVGVTTSAAQLAPLLDGLRQAGTLREVHPTDPVELWLDDAALVPLSVTVRAASGVERARWAARHGYGDTAGDPVLEVVLADIAINGQVDDDAFPRPPDVTVPRDAGFVDQPFEAVDVPAPAWLPEGMTLHRAGVAGGGEHAPEVAVASWSDGRAWVKVRATREWADERLFGGLGEAVRRADLEGGVAYIGEGSHEVAIRGDDIDVVVSGSLAASDLLRVADSLGLEARPVPPSWPEAHVVPVEAVAEAAGWALRPPALEGFAPASARLVDDTLVIAVTGPGARGFVLTQAPDDQLTPPLEPDVRGVEVRGTAGRYTPSTGELEWVEAGRVVSLRSATLSLDELVAVAERLEGGR